MTGPGEGTPALGPVVATELYDLELQKLAEDLRTVLARPFAALMEDAALALSARVRDAYLQGLRDGFVQGSVALHERRGSATRVELRPGQDVTVTAPLGIPAVVVFHVPAPGIVGPVQEAP